MATVKRIEYGIYAARKRTTCPGCGKRVDRRRTFAQLSSPNNITKGGRKRPAQIMAECREDLRLWRSKSEWCVKCMLDEAKRQDTPTDFEVTVWRKQPDGLLLVNVASVGRVRPALVGELALAAAERAIEAHFVEPDCWDIRVETVNKTTNEGLYWQIIPAVAGAPMRSREIMRIDQ